MIGWEEIWKQFGTQLDKNTIIHQWLAGSTVGPNATAKGYRLLWSTSSAWYLDWLDVTWDTMYKQEPCINIGDSTCKNLVLGGGGEMWGETVDVSDIDSTVFPRIAAIAERLWSDRSIYSLQRAWPRYRFIRCLLNSRGIGATPASNANASTAPSGPGSCWQWSPWSSLSLSIFKKSKLLVWKCVHIKCHSRGGMMCKYLKVIVSLILNWDNHMR